MKRTGFAIVLLLTAAMPSRAASVTVTVTNRAGAPIVGAQVLAAAFTAGFSGPDPTKSFTGVTNASGQVAFGSLTDALGYDIFASSQGFIPSINDQFNNPNHPHVAGTGALSGVTISIDSTTAPATLGEIDVDVQGASANALVFADIKLSPNSDPIAVGWTITDASGNAGSGPGSAQPAIKLLNVPFSAAGYQIEGQNPTAGTFFSFPGQVALNGSAPLLHYTSGSGNPLLNNLLNFANSIRPVASQGGAAGGSTSIQGAVVDGSGNPIPFVGVNFEYCSTDSVYIQNHSNSCWTQVWTQADQNGSFQLGGLQNHTTYYGQISGTCYNNTCYKGYTSGNYTAPVANTAPGGNDFIFDGTPLLKRFTLPTLGAASGAGRMAIYVKDQNGNSLPGAWINVSPDYGACGGQPNPGYSQFNGQATTGYVLVDKLLPGRYFLNIGTQFSNQFTQVNAGADGQYNCDADDLAITVDTTSASNQIYIVKASGGGSAGYSNPLSSVTVTVQVSQNTSGQMTGTITFPQAVDLSADPITIALQPQNCGGGPCQGGYAIITNAVGQTTGPIVNYTVHVASGQAYYINTTSNYWGLVHENDGALAANLNGVASITKNMRFVPAGRIVGKLYNPDGTLFVPSNGPGMNAGINAHCSGSWGWTNVNNDGGYQLGGLLPGACSLEVSGYGGYPYTNKLPLPTVTVTAGQDVYADINTVNAIAVKVAVTTTTLGAIPSEICSGQNDQCPAEGWIAKAIAHGQVLSQNDILGLMNVNDDRTGLFGFRASTSAFSGRGCSGPPGPIGFCVNKLPSPNQYDFRLARVGNFDNGGFATPPARPYFVVLNSTQSIPVNASAVDPSPIFVQEQGSTMTVVRVNLTPAASQVSVSTAVFVGIVTAQNLITARNFQGFGGDFNKFLKYLPVVSLYDSNGSLVAGGLVTPNPPSELPFDARLSSDVASGNFSDFQTLINPSTGWGPHGYDIRGVPVGVYTMVVTTPNYPPYTTKVTLTAGANRLDVNLDQLVGQGATLSGTVKTSGGAAIPNAVVTVQADNYPAQTVNTDATGAYTLGGLPAGDFHVTVLVAGYAKGDALASVSANSAATQNFTLALANGAIYGKVIDGSGVRHDPLVGAKIVAFDETASIANPAADQALYKVQTDTTGVYHLTGLISGDTYFVSVQAEKVLPTGTVIQYYVLNQTTTAATGIGNDLDFSLTKKPVDITVVGHPISGAFEFVIKNPGDFTNGDAWIGDSPFVKATSTDVGQGSQWGSFQNLNDNQGRKFLKLDFLTTGLSNAASHVLHVEATAHDAATGKDSTYVKEIAFSANGAGSTSQSTDRAILGDSSSSNDFAGRNANDVPISDDALQNPSVVSFPVGSLMASVSTAVPAMSFTAADAASALQSAALRPSGISASAVSGQVYTLTLSSAQYIAGGPGVDVTLAFNKQDTNTADLALYHLNSVTNQWEIVPGLQTIDPIKGTVRSRIKMLSSVQSLARQRSMTVAVAGGAYRPSDNRFIPDDNGVFAILHPSQVSNAGFTGSDLKVFNFPNPFNLSSKAVPIVNGGATTVVATAGTVIKYELPSSLGGHVMIRIYTLSGQLVREIDEGQHSGGTYNYTVWDGRNRNGSNVANGVYYGILTVDGSKPAHGTFKLAVIK